MIILDPHQVLEYHPEPWNQWLNIGVLNIERAHHAAHSIGTQMLPCLKPGEEITSFKIPDAKSDVGAIRAPGCAISNMNCRFLLL